MKKIVYLSLLMLTMINVTSCATLFGPKSHSLSVNSNPDEAEVFVDGERMGTTPVKIELYPKRLIQSSIEKMCTIQLLRL
jgi:diacylglycerol kinase family enzyme